MTTADRLAKIEEKFCTFDPINHLYISEFANDLRNEFRWMVETIRKLEAVREAASAEVSLDEYWERLKKALENSK